MNARALVLLGTAILAPAANAEQGPVSASATASVSIAKAALTISKDADLSFGTVTASSTAGKVVLGCNDLLDAGATTLSGTSGPYASARFTVHGSRNASYSLTLPGTSIYLNNPNSAQLKVDTFKVALDSSAAASVDPTTVTYKLDNTGKQTIYLGATLNVDAYQEEGLYSNNNLTVTVAYY